MPDLDLFCGRIHYTDIGEGQPLVLLHANPGDSEDFCSVIPALAKSYRVVALDWPGYGKSEMPSLAQVNLDFHLNVLQEFLARLQLDSVMLIGNSIGGHAAARLAITSPHRVRALVLVSPGGFTPSSLIANAFCHLQSSRFALSPYRFARLYLKIRTTASAAMLERAAGIQATDERLALSRKIWSLIAQPDYSLIRAAQKIQAPTLLIFGARDPVISATRDGEQAASAIAHSTFVVMPCGHAPFAELPEQFLAEIEPFLYPHRMNYSSAS